MYMDYDTQVHVVHFSSKIKPAHWIFDPKPRRPTYEDFVETRMLKPILKQLAEEPEGSHKPMVEEHIREVTPLACSEWYAHYEELVSAHGWIKELVENEREQARKMKKEKTPAEEHLCKCAGDHPQKHGSWVTTIVID